MSELRLAIVAPFPPNPQGEAHYTGEYVHALVRQFPEVEVLVIAHELPNAPQRERLAPNLEVCRPIRPDRRWARHTGCWRVWREIRDFRPDIVHYCGGLLPYFGGIFGEPLVLLTRAVRRLGCRQLISSHNTWMAKDLDGLARQKGLRGPAAKAMRHYYRGLIRSLSAALDSFNIVIAGEDSEIARQFVAENALPASNIALEPHACTYRPQSRGAQQTAKEKLGIAGRRLVLAAGFVRPDKGYDVLLKAAPAVLTKFPDSQCWIAGEPSADHAYLRSLEQLQAAAPPDRVRLDLRFLSDAELAQYMDAADIVVIPYLRSVGASGPIHHALGRGRAIVASDVGHNRSLSGMVSLVPPGDIAALADALGALLENPQRMRELEQRAGDYASKHTWDHLAKGYRAFYHEVLSGRQHPLTVIGNSENMQPAVAMRRG